jgi:general L-amino acid transport system permease protein
VKLLARLKPLVGSPLNCAISAASLAFLVWVLPPLLRWGVFNAVWSGGPDACREARGACWTYVGHKFVFFILGFYPADERWRSLLALALLISLLIISVIPRFWTATLALLWPATLALAIWLLGGGLGLRPVPVEQWSGLPLTILLATFALALAFPLGVLLALGRTSKLPFIRGFCAGFVELQRGLPLVATLFMASVLVPLLVPAEATPSKLVRAYIAFMLIISAFIAEIVRGALQAVPEGQSEAATALGLRYPQMMWLIVLPQCLRVSVPPLVGVAIMFFKDTSLVVVIGMTDLLGAVNSAAADPLWLGRDVEGYLFAAAVYFSFCFAASRYAAWLERRLRVGADRIAKPAATSSDAQPRQLIVRPDASTP